MADGGGPWDRPGDASPCRTIRPALPSDYRSGFLILIQSGFLLAGGIGMVGTFRNNPFKIFPAGELKQFPAMLPDVVDIDKPRGPSAQQHFQMLLPGQ